MQRKKAHFEGREPFLEKILSEFRFGKIIKHIPQKAKVLDLGCGFNGNFLQKIRKESGEKSPENYFGLDISVNPNMENIKLIKHNLNNPIPFEDKSFDVVTSLANLEHLENPEFVLEEIYRVLKPKGILLLTAPSVYGKPVLEFLSFRLGLISRNEIEDHKNYFDRESLLKLLKVTGFSSVDHKYFQIFMNNFARAKK